MKIIEASAIFPHITFKGREGASGFSSAVRDSFYEAQAKSTKLSKKIINMEGMSGKKYRIFINNLVSKIADARYLEIGVWKGSTFCSALFKNRVTALGIDDFSGFGGPKNEFFKNVKSTLRKSRNASFEFLEKNFKDVDCNSIGSYNILFYDGDHRFEATTAALNASLLALDEEFILIIDDWNDYECRKAVAQVLKENCLKTVFSIAIRTTGDNSYVGEPEYSHPKSSLHLGNSEWHNGYFLSVIRK